MPSHYDASYAKNAAENYQHYFVPAIGAPAARGLVDAADLRPGERVLDVACGTGVVARLARERVGREGTVTGLDPNPAMLAVAAESTTAEMAVEWHEAPAEAIPLPDDSFDVALCGMGLQFFTDKRAGLSEIRRVLVSGGRLVASLPGPIPPPLGAQLAGLDEEQRGALEEEFEDRCREFVTDGALVGEVNMTTLTATN